MLRDNHTGWGSTPYTQGSSHIAISGDSHPSTEKASWLSKSSPLLPPLCEDSELSGSRTDGRILQSKQGQAQCGGRVHICWLLGLHLIFAGLASSF